MSHMTSRIRPVSQQAATFSRSTGVPNQSAKWEAVFGPMPTQAQPNSYSHYPNVNKQLPDAYIGQNVFLSEKVAGLIATTGAFWTGVLLPWLRSDHIGPFSWSRWEFNQVLATRVPHESVARLVTTEQREYQVRPVRRGLAMQMEGDFVNHPDGQLHFARKIQGMIASVQTTIDFDVQHTILTGNDQRKLEHHRIGINALPIKEELDIEKDMFASISKSIDHFKLMVKRAQVMLMDNGANPPFTLLVTPEAIMDMSYFTKPGLEPQRMIGGGRLGDPQGELGRTDLPVGDFVTPDGTAVFQVRAINFGSKGAPYQMFSKPVLIAEYYQMTWAKYRGANLFDGCSMAPSHRYYSDLRSILIKNETTDRMAKITLAEALKHGGGDNGFPDMTIIRDLANKEEAYKPQDFDPSVNSETGEKIANRMHSKIRRRAHMMLTLGLAQSDRPVRVVHYVGQMDSNVTSAKNIEQMAQTLVASIPGISERDVNTAYDLIALIQTLEDAEYNKEFFKALIKVNSKRNWKKIGGDKARFVGATLNDEAHAAKWNTRGGYVEWRPDNNGAMTLPLWDSATMGDTAVPPGIANFPGLLALRALRKRESGYGDLPNRADAALVLLAKLGVGISSSLTSEAMDAVNRAPWHLKANPLTTLFETAVNIPRDPLFLLAVPYPGGDAGSADFGGPETKPTMAAPPLQRIVLSSLLRSPALLVGAPGLRLRTAEEAVNLFADRLSATGADTAPIFVADTGVASQGAGVVVGDANLAIGLALSPTITALRRLGVESARAYMRINTYLLDDSKRRFQLAGMLNSAGTTRDSARRVILGLGALIAGKSRASALSTIKKVAAGRKSAVAEALARGEEIQKGGGFNDAPIGVFTNEGDEPSAVERIINTGIDVAKFQAQIPDAADRFEAIGNAVDNILSVIALIHQERGNIRSREIADVEARNATEVTRAESVPEAPTLADVPEVYNPNDYFFAFPRDPQEVITDPTKDVAAQQRGLHNADIALLLRQLQDASVRYESVTRGILGSLPTDFAGLEPAGTGLIRGSTTKRGVTPGVQAEPEPIFTAAALADARYYRSALVMTPGLRDTIGLSTETPLVRPSDPATGHLAPWAGGNGEVFPDRLLNRPQYKSFVGREFQRDFSHSIWNSHHLEYLSSVKRAEAEGTGRGRRYEDIFAGSSVPSSTPVNDNIFEDAEMIESLLSGNVSMQVASHVPPKRQSGPSWEYDYPTESGGRRPFAGYTGFDAAVLADGDDDTKDETGAWLINNMNLGSIKYHISESNKITNPLVRWAAMAIILSRIDHVEFWLAMIKHNVLVPCNVMIFRPAIEYVMDNFVLMKAGSDTGGTLFNHSSAMLGWDVYTRMIYLNYLFYSKAFIWGPENIYVLDNAMPRRYIAGCGINWITSIEHLSTQRSHERHDMLAIVLPLEEVEFDEDIGILGDRNQVYGDANPEFDGPLETPQYSSAAYVEAWLKHQSASITRMLMEHKNKRIEYFRTIGTVPAVVSQGYYQSWGIKAFDKFHAGQGHKGDYNDYEGSRKIWNRRGTPYFLKRSEQPIVVTI